MMSMDLLHPVRGGPVPLDHGSALFSVLCARGAFVARARTWASSRCAVSAPRGMRCA
ncbi:hypothetical protein [Myxococcus xanthus]|uniref:hypothetical protein n=1 Tax=Myxococcus xanthus TaxID=34 RepID=UPI001F281CD5|nr:hypothetical protein [Myxococcus xanthus]